jgi:cytidylate kinase
MTTNASIAACVAIDGPTASGKSTVGHALASKLGIGFLDTGMMYRACTHAVISEGINPEDSAAVLQQVQTTDLTVQWPNPTTPQIFVANRDITSELRKSEIEASVSLISRIPAVRDEMVRLQRDVAARSPIVMAGRDIGTRVLTEARTKIFLDASLEIRAQRRLAEEQAVHRRTNIEQVVEETMRRDSADQAAADALVIDTDTIQIDTVVALVLAAYEQANSA